MSRSNQERPSQRPRRTTASDCRRRLDNVHIWARCGSPMHDRAMKTLILSLSICPLVACADIKLEHSSDVAPSLQVGPRHATGMVTLHYDASLAADGFP